MKILYVCNQFFPVMGGIERHVHLLAKKMNERGYETKVLTTKPNKNLVSKTSAGYEAVNGVLVKRASVLPFTFSWLGASPQAIMLLLEEKPDIIHIHGFSPCFITNLSLITGKILGIPTVYTPHYHPFRDSGRLQFYDKKIGPHLIKLADHIIAVTNSEAQFYRSIGIKHVTVIPNATDLKSHQCSPSQTQKFRMGHRLGEDVIISVGRITESKGFHILIQVLPMILSQHPSVQLIIAGYNFGYLPFLKKLAKKLGVLKHVIFLEDPTDSELFCAYECSQFVVISSQFEAFGITILEAWAHKKAVVAVRVGGISDILHSKAGILIPSRKVKVLAKVISSMLLNKDLAKQMGEFGHSLIRSRYSIDIVASQVLSVYSNALRSTR